MIVKIVVVALLIVCSRTNSAFVNPVSENTCQTCCNRVSALDATFSLSFCQVQGCTGSLETSTSADQCSSLLSNAAQVLACEIGRDFRFAGVSQKVVSGKTHQCVDRGGNPAIEEISFTNPTALQISNTTCINCCTSLDTQADGTSPNDFTRASCQASCTSSAACFGESIHRNRLGCLIALDFLTVLQVQLRNNLWACNANGVATLVKVFSPTVSPTKSPTPSPTRSPTKFPTPQPTISPSRSPVVPSFSPTVFVVAPVPSSAPTKPVNGSGQDDDPNSPIGSGGLDQIFVIIITVLAVTTCWGIVGVVLFSRGRSKSRERSKSLRNNSEFGGKRDVILQVHINEGGFDKAMNLDQDRVIRLDPMRPNTLFRKIAHYLPYTQAQMPSGGWVDSAKANTVEYANYKSENNVRPDSDIPIEITNQMRTKNEFQTPLTPQRAPLALPRTQRAPSVEKRGRRSSAGVVRYNVRDTAMSIDQQVNDLDHFQEADTQYIGSPRKPSILSSGQVSQTTSPLRPPPGIGASQNRPSVTTTEFLSPDIRRPSKIQPPPLRNQTNRNVPPPPVKESTQFSEQSGGFGTLLAEEDGEEEEEPPTDVKERSAQRKVANKSGKMNNYLGSDFF